LSVSSCCFTSFFLVFIPLSFFPVSRTGCHRIKYAFLRLRIKHYQQRSLLRGVSDHEKPVVVTSPHDMLTGTDGLNFCRRDVVPGNMCGIPIVPQQSGYHQRNHILCSIMAFCATQSQERKWLHLLRGKLSQSQVRKTVPEEFADCFFGGIVLRCTDTYRTEVQYE